MSPKVRYAIAGALAVLMMVSPISYANGIEPALAVITGQQIAGSNTEAEILDTTVESPAPNSILVGIDTLEIIAPEWDIFSAGFVGEKNETETEVKEPLAGEEEAETDEEAAENEPETEAGTEAETEPEEEEEIIPSAYDGIAVVTIREDYLNVRADANADAALVGRMYPGTKGTIIEEKDGWYHIVSGNVDGWISGNYAVTGREAEAFVKENMETKITVAVDVLNVRWKPDAESEAIDYVIQGNTFSILDEVDGWYYIESDPGVFGYVSSKYMNTTADLGNGMTNAEVAAYERQKALEAKAASLGAQLRGKTYATEEEIMLLAALCRHEAGKDSYEAALAVANVVINRMHNGYWGTDIASVIYAPGQFQYVEDGALNQWMGNPGANCLQAARDALDGINTVGGYIFFRSAKTAQYSEYVSWVEIGGNVFYTKH